MNKISLCSLLILTGCANSPHIVYKKPGWVEDWTSSNSICADGIFINQANSGCYSVQIERDDKGILWMKCILPENYPKNKLNYWNSNIFVVVPRTSASKKEKKKHKTKLAHGMKPICGDAAAVAGKITETKFFK